MQREKKREEKAHFGIAAPTSSSPILLLIRDLREDHGEEAMRLCPLELSSLWEKPVTIETPLLGCWFMFQEPPLLWFWLL